MNFNWRRPSMSAAVCSEASLVFAVQPGSYNEVSIMDFLLELHRRPDGDKVALIWHCGREL
jgi:hypothetical protein